MRLLLNRPLIYDDESAQGNRPAGILLHGRNLHRGHSLNDLARSFLINGMPVASIENLLASLDSAAKRSKCRLPIVIDGLNEAENPKDWKGSLDTLNETIKRYPNVLVVCTLRTGEHKRDAYSFPQSHVNERESFALQALPADVRKIEYDGFGGDVQKATERYFTYYKISTGDAEIPLDYLNHPLTMRIFCEVTNPRRDSVVKIEQFSYSLSVLLEKYVENICSRISQMINLEQSFRAEEIQYAIYLLGLEMWKAKKRYFGCLPLISVWCQN